MLKSKFRYVNLLLCKLGFLPFYGLSAAFMAFLLKPLTSSEQLFAKLTQITEKIIKFEFFGLWPLNLAFEKKFGL